MLAGNLVFTGMRHQPVERAARKNIDAFMGAQGAGFQLYEIAIAHAVHEIVDQAGIDQRRIAGNAQQCSGARHVRRQTVTLQDILQGAARANNTFAHAEMFQRVVNRFDGTWRRRSGRWSGIARSL